MEVPNPERGFIRDKLQRDFEDAKERLTSWYIGDDTRAFSERLMVDIIEEHERGVQIPTARYDSRTKRMHMRVEPNTLLHYADELAEGTELSTGDVVRTLMGAGVARCVLGWKLLPIRILGENDPRRHELQEKLWDKTALSCHAERFDAIHGTSLEGSIERLGETEVGKINVLRFAVGASLAHMPDAESCPPQWWPVVEKRLVEAEHERALDLRTALAIFEADSQFQTYDDTVAQQLLAMNFPMTPAEELAFFAVTPLR